MAARIAIILARGGSRRIPRKNIRPFLGRPMIAWPIEAARASSLFDHVVVSTDDDEIAAIAEAYGAEVPFRRPPALAGDDVSTDEALLDAVERCSLFETFDVGCCIYPTAPFLTPRELELGLELLVRSGGTSAFPVVPYDFPIEQAFVVDGHHPRARWPKQLQVASRDLPTHYHDAGMFYWFDVAKFRTSGQLFSDDSAVFVLDSALAQDINTPEDWRRAEIKYRVLEETTDR